MAMTVAMAVTMGPPPVQITPGGGRDPSAEGASQACGRLRDLPKPSRRGGAQDPARGDQEGGQHLPGARLQRRARRQRASR